MKKKLLSVALATIIAVMAISGASLAWLQDTTQTVTNTFTKGLVDIDLTETGTTNNEKSYKMVPGDTLTKDPTVEVLANSEACWLFIEITEVNDVDTFLSYSIAAGWTLYDTTTQGENIDTKTNDTYVIYRKVTQDDAQAGKTYEILMDNEVTVNEDVTVDQMNDLDGSNNPQLKFTAYAVQSANVEEVQDAWEIIRPTNPNP